MKHIIMFIGVVFMFLGCAGEKEVKQNSFTKAKALIGKENVVLEVGASTCASCVEMKKLISDLKKENPNVPIAIVDVYEDKDSVAFFDIQLIPTQIVYNKDGEEVFRHVGALSKDELLGLVELSKKDI